MKITLLLLTVFLVADCLAQPLPLDKAIRKGKLANGFTYYIRKNTEPARRVQLYLVNKVGSILEKDNQRGLAHFMEHMSFNGTKHFPKNDLVHYLQKSGVRFGADLNAYTSFDETVYQLPIPTDEPALLKNGLQIMRDWAGNATLDTGEINSERGVVLEEKRLGKGAQERMRVKTFPVILNHSRYSDRIPIGVDEVLNNFKKPSILDFYKTWYRPDLQALIVVGDINVDSMEVRIKKLFGDLKNPPDEKPRIKYTIPLNNKNQFVAVTDKEFPYTVIQVMIKRKEVVAKTKQEYDQLTNRELFNQMLAARIAELSQQPNPPFIQAAAEMGGFLGGLDAFIVSVVSKPGLLEKSFESVWQLIQQLKQFGFTEGELNRAKTSYLSYFASAVREKDKRNSQQLVEEYTRNFLTGESAPGIEAEYDLVDAHLKTVKLADINALAPLYIADSNRDVVIMAPQKDSASLPGEGTVNGWIKIVGDRKLSPYEDEFKKESLLSSLPPAGKVTDVKKLKDIDVTVITLSNGMKVVLKPTDFKNDEIRFNAFSPGGSSLYPDSDFESASSAAYLVENSGLSHFKPTDFPKLLSGKQLNVEPYISERSEGVRGVSTPKDLETAFQLIHLYFTSPRKDSVIFKNIIDQSENEIADRYNDPANVYSDTVAAVLGDYSIRRTGPSLEKLHQINLDKSLAIYRERFANAGNFTFLFTGNFAVDSIRPLLEKYLGSLPSTGKKEEARDLKIHIPTGVREAIARKGKEPKATVRLVISGDYTYSPENNIQLTALSEILQFRITDRLREKEGGTYSPSVRVSYNKYPANRYVFTILFGCGPENVDKLIADTKEEINKLKTEGATALDITKFSTEEQRQYELHLKENPFWLNWLSAQFENGDDPAVILNYPQLIKEVTTSSVKASANEYLNENNFIKLLLLPENSQ
ncbi:MAG: insulinase family protein [Bacteroidota bacterium]|nr:insulinase family protein [Bacteroidota bacterium]MDP4248530.1 insulinase family protein [Bacteroidota bacterium]